MADVSAAAANIDVVDRETGVAGDTANDSNAMEVPSKAIVKMEPVTEVDPEKKPEKPEEIPTVPFTCAICNFTKPCQYKGKTPRFARNIQFNEECYLIQDPFSPPPGHLSTKSTCEHFIVIGSDCSQCGNAVCQLNSCCIFYQKTYCSVCAHQLLNTFPAEVQSKIRKFCKIP